MDTRTIYFICDNGSIYTSDKRDLASTPPYDSPAFQSDQTFTTPYEVTPYLDVSGLSGVNPTAKTVKSYNGFLYNAGSASVKMTLTFPTMRSAQVVLANLSEHLVFLSVAVDQRKQHLYTKRAMLQSIEKTDSVYTNGVQYDIQVAVDGFWTGTAFNDYTSGSSVTIPANFFPQPSKQVSKWNGTGVVPGDNYPNVCGIKISCPSGAFSITVKNSSYNQDVYFDTTGYPMGTTGSLFVGSNGLMYRQDREDLIGLDTYLRDIGHNFTPALSEKVGAAGMIQLGGLNLGQFVTNKSSQDQAYDFLLRGLKLIGVQDTTVSVSGCTIQGVACLELKPFI